MKVTINDAQKKIVSPADSPEWEQALQERLVWGRWRPTSKHGEQLEQSEKKILILIWQDPTESTWVKTVSFEDGGIAQIVNFSFLSHRPALSSLVFKSDHKGGSKQVPTIWKIYFWCKKNFLLIQFIVPKLTDPSFFPALLGSDWCG